MINDLIQKYLTESAQTRAKMQAKLFSIFTETTGHRPEDICLVEQQIVKDRGLGEYKTIYYFDWKHRHQQGFIDQPPTKEASDE